MINRNRNSAVDRARAEMKQAVNSSRRVNSARIGRTKEVKVLQGNYGYNWDDLIEYEVNDSSAKQDFRDYEENEPQYRHRIIRRRVPNPDYVEKETKETVDETVEVSSSRHMSYKTRKAIEYSINCARRRAGYNR